MYKKTLKKETKQKVLRNLNLNLNLGCIRISLFGFVNRFLN